MTTSKDSKEGLKYSATDVPPPDVNLESGMDEQFVGKAEPATKQRRHVLQIERQSVESPFLPPDYLKEYERISPGLGKELIQVIIEHQRFQMEVKNQEIELMKVNFIESAKVNDANIREQDSLNLARSREIRIKERGQIFAVAITLLLLVFALIFALLGFEYLAGACIAIIVAMSAVMFLQKTTYEKADDKNKNDSEPPSSSE